MTAIAIAVIIAASCVALGALALVAVLAHEGRKERAELLRAILAKDVPEFRALTSLLEPSPRPQREPARANVGLS